MRTETVAIVALLLGISAPAAAQESVTLSRYRLSVLVDPGPGETDALQVDLTKLTERCGDADGCEVTLLLAAGIPGDPSTRFVQGAKQARLYLGSSGTWTIDSAPRGDPNGVVENVLDLVATEECVFSDGEFPGNTDLVAGFWLKMILGPVGNSWVCTLTVID
jgi:hypothetical protein